MRTEPNEEREILSERVIRTVTDTPDRTCRVLVQRVSRPDGRRPITRTVLHVRNQDRPPLYLAIRLAEIEGIADALDEIIAEIEEGES